MLLKRLLIVITIFASLHTAAQPNLVPNPSFEQYIDCPLNLSGIPYSKNYSGFKTVSDWSCSVYGATPDYFNRCVPPIGQVDVPYNTVGYQEPRTGDAYTGMIVYNKFSTPFPYKYIAEYLYCKLTSKLVAGQNYKVSFYVSATHPNDTTSIYSSIDRIGAYLSDTIAYDTFNRRLEVPFHIRSKPGVVLDDTGSWVLISGIYKANGGEEYLFIGNFDDNSQVKVKPFFPNVPSQSVYSYYYIDDVSVQLDTHCDTFTTATDRKLCANEFITLSSSVDSADSYTWNQGQGTKTINVYQPGTYWVAATKDTCDLYVDTFHVAQFADAVISFKDRLLCTADSSTIDLAHTLTDADSFLWNTGENTSTITIKDTGLYNCTAIKECDITIEYFRVRSIVLEDELSLGNDTSLCDGITYTLGKPLSEDIKYKWNTGDGTCCIDINNSGDYVLSITNGCNTKKDSINIEFYECVDCIWVPSVFTPNGDGRNDRFKAFSKCPLEMFEIIVVNRWGEKVFTSNDVLKPWDGQYNGKHADVGAYHYLIKYRTQLTEQTEVVKGDVTLLR